MSFTADIYKEICTDIAKNSRPNSVYAMRMLKLSNGINIAFSIIIETYHGLTTSKPMQLRCFQSG